MKKPSKVLLKKFHDGNCSMQEVHEIMTWVYSEQYEKNFEESLNQYLNKEIIENVDIDSEALYRQIVSKTVSTQNGTLHKRLDTGSRNGNFDFFKIIKVAASIALIITAGWWFTKSMNFNEEVIASNEQVTPASMLVKKTDFGEKLTVSLPDGSAVKLNAGSKIEFDKNSFRDNRSVNLSGEAFFDVVKDKHRPFKVVTDQMKVTVLGTSFNVSTAQNESGPSVAVKTGMVNVRENLSGNSVILNPMEVTESFDGNTLQKKKIKNKELLFGWTDQIIAFENNSLAQIVKKLERWYGVEFTITNLSNYPQTYTGTFKNKSLKFVVESVSYAYGFEYELNNMQVLVK